MASIKDVANRANVSISTVSIIINGKSQERKISEQTQQRVFQAMKALNYQPNLSAKKLRLSETKKTIALFWTTDFRDVMLARFLNGLQDEIRNGHDDYDIVIYPYENDQLEKEEQLTRISSFHGAIIANASAKDLAFLKTLKPMVPIVLYNRCLDHYSSVSVDDQAIAAKVFELIQHKKQVGMIEAPYVFPGMKTRDDYLKELLIKNHQKVVEYQVKENDANSAFEISGEIDFENLDVIYTASDMIALGLMHYCYQHRIRIPEDVEVIAVGNGLVNIDAFLNPSLSVVQIPMEKMAAACIQIMSLLFSRQENVQKTIEPETILRDSLSADSIQSK